MEKSSLPHGFHVDLLFPDKYSDFIAEVYFRDILVFTVSQESGPEELEIEFSPDVRGFPDRMPLSSLQDSIAYALRRLEELRKKH